jgi:hypothetical protein
MMFSGFKIRQARHELFKHLVLDLDAATRGPEDLNEDEVIVSLDLQVRVDTQTEPKSTLPQSPKLLDKVRSKLRVKHYNIRTEDAAYAGLD